MLEPMNPAPPVIKTSTSSLSSASSSLPRRLATAVPEAHATGARLRRHPFGGVNDLKRLTYSNPARPP